jgi:hypothetical protein
LYGAVDIPETESFGRLEGGDGHPLLFKFASSAAHVMGRPLVSSETATWLDEHFHETLGQIKEMVDRQMLAGVNHVIYHGTAYSPADAAWPGWVFYASTQLNPQNPIWRDLPALNDYVTRCQSILQSTKPDNDVLLYWPIHDLWQNADGLRMDFRVHNANEWLFETSFGQLAQMLSDRGIAFDYVSDRQLSQCQVKDGRIQAPGGSYAHIFVPKTKFLPNATARTLVGLARDGASIVFQNALPAAAPGYLGATSGWQGTSLPEAMGATYYGVPTAAKVGRGQMRIATYAERTDVRRESWHKPGKLNFIRRQSLEGWMYFVKNESGDAFDDWITPAVDWKSVAIMDPSTGRIGVAAARTNERGTRQLRLQLAAGQTAFIKALREELPTEAAGWIYDETGVNRPIEGQWTVEFIDGGPELPPPAKVDNLESWTDFAGAAGERFAGTARYSIAFDAPAGAGRYRMDLGQVADSARVELNGKPVATLIAAPFQCAVELAERENRLVVEVSNVAANRIRDLDRRRVPWKTFKDINVVGVNYRPLDASRWPVRDAGLLGPVTIQPLKSSRAE